MTCVFRIVPLVATSVAVITFLIFLRTSARPGLGYFAAAAQWVTSWGEPPLLGYPNSGRMNAFVLWSLWYEWLFYLVVLPVSLADGRGQSAMIADVGCSGVGDRRRHRRSHRAWRRGEGDRHVQISTLV